MNAKTPKSIKVLIAEDNSNICELYAMAFMRKGFTVYTASDGEAALEKFHNKRPDVILLDIMMPNVDGYQVLAEVRKDVGKKYVPIIMLTNLDASHFMQEAQLDDIDEYLVKSHYSPSEIVEKTIDVLKLNHIV